MRALLRQKIADALAMPLKQLTKRDSKATPLPNKATAVIGMRRSGKTSFLWQCLGERLAAGRPRTSLLYFSFEDERLFGMTAAQLSWIVEEYYGLCPDFRDQERVTFFFDEIQLITGWERFIRRILDTENAEIFVSGSSAKLLSREVGSSLRGRAWKTLLFPFSFREYLRHQGHEPTTGALELLSKRTRSLLDAHCSEYLYRGGFPEAQALSSEDRVLLLQDYVDVVIFRDVIERHNITNVIALKQLVYHLLANPGSLFSTNKFYLDMKSQGISLSKDTLYALVDHLEDAFLIRTVPYETTSVRQRNIHPKKVYPVDTGLITAYDRSGKMNIGHALETAVEVELERRGASVSYSKTKEGWEIDFVARFPNGKTQLIQVVADLMSTSTQLREFRALQEVPVPFSQAERIVITCTHEVQIPIPSDSKIHILPAWKWFLMT